MILKILMRKPLYEMANLSTEDSKLYYNIWIDSVVASRNTSQMLLMECLKQTQLTKTLIASEVTTFQKYNKIVINS